MRGTGGSAGVAFLKKALDIEFFPELIRVRTEIGADMPSPRVAAPQATLAKRS